MLTKSKLNLSKVSKIIKDNNLVSTENIISFLVDNKNNYSYFDLSKIAEHANQMRMENSAYYTDEELLNNIEKHLPVFTKKIVHILEPSVGVGNFIPLILKKYKDKSIYLDVVDIDGDSLKILNTLLSLNNLSNNVVIRYYNCDFCDYVPDVKYDLAIGNPPFSKVRKEYFNNKDVSYYANLSSTNLASYFYEKCLSISNEVCMVLPKNILNTPEFNETRKYLRHKNIKSIIDFGENGFKGVLVETICLISNNNPDNGLVDIYSLSKKLQLKQKSSYIFDDKLPYWVIYRNNLFDDLFSSLEFGVFKCFRDRQISNKNTHHDQEGLRVLKSRNISDNGQHIIDIDNYDEYIDESEAKDMVVYSYLNKENVYLTPNMTYKTRVMKKPKGYLVNGSVAILIPKKLLQLNKEDLLFYSSQEYREFMQIARNYQTRTLNIDSSSVFFFGVKQNNGRR